MTEPIESLTPRDAAAALAISERQLRRLVLRGELKATRLGRRCVRYRVSELRRYLDRKTRAVPR